MVMFLYFGNVQFQIFVRKMQSCLRWFRCADFLVCCLLFVGSFTSVVRSFASCNGLVYGFGLFSLIMW